MTAYPGGIDRTTTVYLTRLGVCFASCTFISHSIVFSSLSCVFTAVYKASTYSLLVSVDSLLQEIYINTKLLQDRRGTRGVDGWHVDQTPHDFIIPSSVQQTKSMLVALKMKLTDSNSTDNRKGGFMLDNNKIYTLPGNQGWRCFQPSANQTVPTDWYRLSMNDSTWSFPVGSLPGDVYLPNKFYTKPLLLNTKWIHVKDSQADQLVYCRGFMSSKHTLYFFFNSIAILCFSSYIRPKKTGVF